jgi:hypothetical protein
MTDLWRAKLVLLLTNLLSFEEAPSFAAQCRKTYPAAVPYRGIGRRRARISVFTTGSYA